MANRVEAWASNSGKVFKTESAAIEEDFLCAIARAFVNKNGDIFMEDNDAEASGFSSMEIGRMMVENPAMVFEMSQVLRDMVSAANRESKATATKIDF